MAKAKIKGLPIILESGDIAGLIRDAMNSHLPKVCIEPGALKCIYHEYFDRVSFATTDGQKFDVTITKRPPEPDIVS